MTYYEDLSAYAYFPGQEHMLNVGWLDDSHPFPTGKVAPEVVQKLIRLADSSPRNVTRGFHVCQICGPTLERGRIPADNARDGIPRGSYEIHVTGDAGRTFAAPSLIIHYIIEHHYLPPAEFLAAVEMLTLGGKPARSGS